MTIAEIKARHEAGLPVWINKEQFVIGIDTDWDNDEVWIHDPGDNNRFDKVLTTYQATVLLSSAPCVAVPNSFLQDWVDNITEALTDEDRNSHCYIEMSHLQGNIRNFIKESQ